MSDFLMDELKQGHVVATYTNRADVQLANDMRLACTLKATLKKSGIDVLTGDTVMVELVDTGTGRIVEVLPRQNSLVRPKIANVDGVLVVQSLTKPTLDTEQLDRYLTLVALAQLPVAICLTKKDLLSSDDPVLLAVQTYQQLGYTLFAPNFANPQDYTELATGLSADTTKETPTWVLAGVSGAGKSSLLNKMNPTLRLQEGDVSQKLERGQHTTRHVSLLAVNERLLIADTPGFSRLSFDTVEPLALAQAWPEFQALQNSTPCGFANCLHLDEGDCAVTAALGKTILPARYEHYATFMAEAQAGEAQRQNRSEKTEYGVKQHQQKGGKHAARVRLDERLRDKSRRQERQALRHHSYFGDDDEIDD